MSCSADRPTLSVKLSGTQSESDLAPLFGRTLVLVAHPDDETACAALLQRAPEAIVVFCTDGAPSAEYFWGRYGSRADYAAVRRREAENALRIAGKAGPDFLRDALNEPFKDQELYPQVRSALSSLLAKASHWEPQAILAPAYEGGHPDHDTCSFLAYLLGRKLGIPVWEMPLYHRADDGSLVHQEFLSPAGPDTVLPLTPAELDMRRAMFAAYASQPDASDFVCSSVERYRPQPAYDFCIPPQPTPVNYEAWGWPMTSTQVSEAFRSVLVDCTWLNTPIVSNRIDRLSMFEFWKHTDLRSLLRFTQRVPRRESSHGKLAEHTQLLRTISGTIAAGVIAGLAAGVFQHLPQKSMVPAFFVAVIGAISALFGIAAGILGSLAAAAIFAIFLLPPIGSLGVGDMGERSSVTWMLLLGITLSYLLGKTTPGTDGSEPKENSVTEKRK
jgi:LmbE family N-acetylglucosaminyl deacetylase